MEGSVGLECGWMMTTGNKRKHLAAVNITYRICMVVVAVLLWAFFMSTLQPMPPLHPGTRMLLVVLYAVVLCIFCGIYHCLQLGKHRIRELTAWFSLALFFTNLFGWAEVIIINAHFIDIWLSLGMWVVQSLVGMLTIVPFTRRYYRAYEHKEMLAILSDTAYEKQTLVKLLRMPERFRLKRVVLEKDFDIVQIRAMLDGCNTIFVGEVKPGLKATLTEYCFENSVVLIVLPSPADIMFSGDAALQISDSILFASENIGLTFQQRFFKRALDIVVSVVVLVLSAIPIVVCAIIIKATDGGTVFFRQRRYTKDGALFTMVKLRSMSMDSEKDGARLATSDDDRITSIGRFMRRTRLDEVPQFVNVLKGEMSVVGPRAERLETTDAYTAADPAFSYRLKVKAGITGYAQINGRYNTSYEDKIRMDLYYIEHYSLFRDFSEILETLKVLFAPDSTAGFEEGQIDEMISKSAKDPVREQ